MNDELDEYRQQLMEGVAETSEELMEKFFAEEPFTEEEIKTAIVSSIAKRDLMPIHFLFNVSEKKQKPEGIL